ncbi:MAG TPA: 6-phosphogluconolactonase [Candidatus Koribacter sp.]|jgi:6-phosphogluconolactonase
MNVTKTIDFREKGKVLVTPDVHALDDACAEMIVKAAADAIAARGRFTIALSGGSTPKPLYALLATEPWRTRIDWSRTHFFLGDERFVPSTSNQSNFKMANDALISKVPVPADNVHRIDTDHGEPVEAAEEYEEEIRKFFGPKPRLDFNLLGIGTNGHTASLFPGRPTLKVRDRLVVADEIPEVHMWRITFTVPLINDSRCILFLVAGADKAGILNQVLRGPHEPERLPSQLIRANGGSLIWLMDEAAAANL